MQPVLLRGLALYLEQKLLAEDSELKLPDCTLHTTLEPDIPFRKTGSKFLNDESLLSKTWRQSLSALAILLMAPSCIR